MMRNFDLHCHSTASDGLLAPAVLVQRAATCGVDVLALTDHDDTSALAEARRSAEEIGIKLIDGVEVSVTWGDTTIHIVGLGIDPENRAMQEGLQSIRSGRAERAKQMASDLERVGIPGSLEGAYAFVSNPNLIGRTHFARFLVEKRHVSDVKSAFHHYLVAGKPGFVPHQWATLADALGYIRSGGGIAVVAHPGRYKLTRTEMRKFLGEFKDGGGTGIEVVTGSHTPDQYLEYGMLAREFGFLASRGSDFHGPGESRIELGKLPNLPADLKPVWHDWGM